MIFKKSCIALLIRCVFRLLEEKINCGVAENILSSFMEGVSFAVLLFVGNCYLFCNTVPKI